jgi:D-alanyl-D-alanine carboxypeptidase
VEERFIKPLQLVRTEPSTRRQFTNLAVGYVTVDSWIPLRLKQTTTRGGLGGGGRGADAQPVLIFNPGFEWTGGGYLTNAQDLAIWASALYRGKAMPGPYLDELLAPYPDVPKSPYGAAGLGVGIQHTKFGPAYGHGGTMPGYASAMNYFPDLKLSIAVQANAGDFDRLGVLLDLIEALQNARCASVPQ